MFSNYNGIKLEINSIKITGNEHLKTKQHTLNNPWFKEEILREIKNILKNLNKNTAYHNV